MATKYKIVDSKRFSKNFKKLSPQNRKSVREILNRLANDEILEPKYRDHKLKGSYDGLRECHILPDLLLIYEKCEDILILNALRIGSHSELF
ncbi:type II toxin-antitoxin system YafQ family toxin [Helicobacter sp. 11S02596-1]|uniref:type II toxin-antitoxin system YafQ family toxin n=1 Tax=Helicobacter sp. 11S02596-1 TaxID=1476194 RepID=UPI000BA776EB|nr:type II toxin-antitoxin system YafQ family toxin [Helicobacter sp. 11S02596-1]PAF41287.1 addiction module toxin RelE [Helicobacter sp. 11S02596-1]